MLKIRRSFDRLVFNMGIPIPRKDGLYIEMGPWCHLTSTGIPYKSETVTAIYNGNPYIWKDGLHIETGLVLTEAL